MDLTAHCDVFAALHEDGFNRVVEILRSQRPSLFNYATALLAGAPGRLCTPIDPHPIVFARENPLVTIVDPLPIPGTGYGVNFSLQLSKIALDFHPGNVITLPPELRPLKPQRFALQLSFCAGFGCPADKVVDSLIPPPDPPRGKGRAEPAREIIPIPYEELHCFCLDVFAVGGVRMSRFHGKDYLDPFLDRIEIADIKPDGLENGMECYIELLLKLGVLPKLRVLLEAIPMELLKDVLSIRIKPTPISGNVPNNPAIEGHSLKAFVNVEVI